MTAPTKHVREIGDDDFARHRPGNTVLARTEAPGEPWPVAVGLPPADPARYQRIEEFARGGLGRILKVRDLRIGRIVAVKEMRRTGEAARARFVREAKITACLEHPAIVPVHDIGRWPSGEPFYSMKMIAGRSLQDVISDARDLDERLALLPNVIAVADAIAYAHSQGIIHRDLKPANVVVGAFGETVVIDWGLAKHLATAGDGDGDGVELEAETEERATGSGGRSLTVAGAVLGTPCYMPPEQAGGQPVDERADVYALGAMLYEVLAGTPPYQARATSVAVLTGPPPPVETRQSMIPPDLAAIVRKAMARDADDRYPSARELAVDLRRFQTGRLVSAQAYSSGMLIRRWLRRYRAPVTVAAVALSILAVVGGLSVDRVVTERDVARRRTAQLVLAQARSTLDSDATQALAWLRTYPEDGADRVEVRARPFAFAPDGKRLAATGHDGIVSLWDLEPCGASITGCRPVPRLLDDGAGPMLGIAFSPDGRWLASSSDDATVRLWDLVSGQARRLARDAPSAYRLTFSPDGQQLVAAGATPDIWLWDVASGDQVALRSHGDRVHSMTFSRDGRSLWTSSADRTVREWQLATRTSRIIGRRLGPPLTFALAPRDRWIATGDSGGRVALVDPATLAERTLGHHGATVTGLAFSRDGRRLASAGYDGMVRLWDVEHGTLEAVFQIEADAFSFAFAPDGRSIATWGVDGVVRIRRTPPPGAVPDDLHGLATWMARLSTASPDAGQRAP